MWAEFYIAAVMGWKQHFAGHYPDVCHRVGDFQKGRAGKKGVAI